MKLLLTLFLLVAVCGCERSSHNYGLNEDVLDRKMLLSALIEGRIAAVDNQQQLSTISDLLSIMEKQGHIAIFTKYGRTNVFLNPQISIWKNYSLSNRIEAAEYAIVIRRMPSDYVGVTFEARYLKQKQCPAKWCE